jgi:hypothetical protein
MPPIVAWALSILKVFFYLSHLPLVWGVILAKVISKKTLLGSKGTANDIFLASGKDYQRWPFFISNACI